ncbi:MAG: AfsR/SARP family transcriptional regulator, partial [Thermodesulfobacteriota bacterium]
LISNRVGFHQIAFGCYLTQAEFALDAGDETAARNSLQKAMAIGKARQYVNTWLWRSDAMARLCCKALEENIEVAYVQNLILRRNLIPQSPPLEIENWPWPIRIYTLGRFALIKDGKPLQFAKKGREKPLAMLKTIIALGGRNVSENHVVDQLWPDADGDAAHGSFKTNLHRLRKLLGYYEAIRHSEGKITLDPRYCRVDVWVFERLLSRADAVRQSAVLERDLQKAAELTQKALEHYKGRLFQSDEVMAVSRREYLHHRFIRSAEQLGNYLQERKEWEKAIALYENGLKIDELVESFYRGLMVCNHRLGRRARAWKAYNRCKKVLAENLNTSPSAKTEALKNSLLNQ